MHLSFCKHCYKSVLGVAIRVQLADSRTEHSCLLWSLQLSEGSGSILVVAVGVNTEYGKTMSLVMTEAASTPLQEHLEVLAASIGKVGFVVAVICFIVLLIR